MACSDCLLLSPHLKDCERGLRLCIFSAEEWALAGSKLYLDRMSQTERARMQMNINLDTVAGDDHLTALTSDFPAMVNLTTLAPDIVQAILEDALPDHLTLFDLAVDPPALWEEQRLILTEVQRSTKRR